MDAEKIETNTPKAYIHFERATAVAFFHNSREAFLPQTSYEELRGKNICDRTATEARALFQKLDAEADAAFLAKAGRRTNMKEGNKIWEYICLLKEDNTWEDVERLMRRVEQETGYTTLQASLHEDEGHVDENGIFRKNRHIQVDVFTRSLEDGRSLCLENYGKKDLMKRLQKIVSEELGLEEGEPKELTKRKHIPHRKYRAMKEAEKQAKYEQKLEKNNSEWEAKLAQNNKEWEARKAEWEAKQAAREARQAEWEKKLPEIMAARRKNEQFLNAKVDWETLKVANRAFLAWHDVSTDILGYPNPNGNLLVEQTKGALASIFRLFGSVSQLAIFLLTRTEARELKLQNTLNVYKVSENLQRAINLVKNDTTNDHVKIVEKIQNVYNNLPVDKRAELIELAILHAPNDEIREDLRALVEGRFEDIAKSEQAQRRIENRDLKAALKEYAAEAKRIKDELKEMDEENRILNLAERALLREKGAGREEYSEQEAANKARQEEIKGLKDEAKKLKKDLDEARKQQEVDKNTLKEQAEQIEELTAQIAKISAENIAKQKELEDAKEETRRTAPQTPPKDAFDIFDIIDEQKPEKPEPEPREEPKIEPVKIEPEPKPAKDDFTNIYGYDTPTPEPRRRFDYEPRKREIDERPKYEPEPFRDPWQEITDSMEKWKKTDNEVEKNFLKTNILQNIEKYEKSGVPPHRQLALDGFRRTLNYDPAAADAEEIRKIRERELERKRQQAEIETSQKFEEVKKSVKQEADARQTTIKKKKKDELEFGSI